MQESGARTHREVSFFPIKEPTTFLRNHKYYIIQFSRFFSQTDVFGGCKTEFSFNKDGDSLVVHKSRDLASCSHRETIRQGLITAAWNPNAELQSSPLLNSQQKIEQRFKRGVLNKAVSTETYVLRPFSNGDAGAKSVVETILTYKGQKADAAAPAPVTLSKSLIFEAPHPIIDSSVAAITKALRAVKEECPDIVKENAATKFAELVKVLGVSSKNDILTVYNQVKSGAGFDKNSDKSILLDALLRTGTGEAAEVAIELIKNREVSLVQAHAFYASLAFVRHVNQPTITAITSLLEQNDLPRIGYLGIGQIIGKFCDEHDCSSVPEVKAALGKILAKVGNGKYETREKENTAIMALKALGNARYHDDATMEKIATIASDKKASNRVRVAAIEALPSTCSAKWPDSLIKVLANREEDTEIRIKSYLSLVRCACPHVANKIKEILDKETVNQVGSFITSHLRNLRASTDPTKQAAKSQLSEIKPRTKFPEDIRKFSFNNELSYNIGAFGLGSTIETNVIYSQKSFVPRSSSLNLTTEIFGHSFNFLELDTRVENLDRLIEHYFGPKGELVTRELGDLALNGKTTFTDIYAHLKERLGKSVRGRREIKQEALNKFAKKVNLGDKAVDDDLDLDLSLKMFGVELAYLDYHAGDAGGNPNGLIDKIFDIIDKGLNEAKKFDHKLEKHLHFLDADLVYPTGLGIPLTLGITGTSVVHLKASGSIDLPAMIRDPNNAAVRIALEPSAAITIVGNMIVEGFGVESGLRLISTLHTSTGSDISIKLLEGKGIDVSFGIPKRKQEIISVSSEILLASGKHGEKYVAPKFSKGKEHSDCFDQFSTLIGLTVCGKLSYPYDTIESVQKKPVFPLSGPTKFAISIENNDVTNYHFKVYYDTKDPKSRSLEVTFETPNSKNNRRISLKLEGALEPNKFIHVSLDSPYKQISAKALLKNTPEEKSISITANNDVDNYALRAGVVMSTGNKYKPILEYKVPEHIEKLANARTGVKGGSGQIYKVDGEVEVNDFEGGKKYNFNNVNLVASGRSLASLDGFVASKPDGVVTDLKIAHGEENLSIKMDAKKIDRRLSLDLVVVPSKDPNIGFKVLWHFDTTPDLMDHSFVFVYGADLESKTNRLTITDKLSYKKSQQLKVDSRVTWPAQELSSTFEIEALPTSGEVEVDFKYGKFKIGTELDVKIGDENKRDIAIEFKAHALESKFALKAKRTKLAEHKNKFEGSIELPSSKYEVDTEVTYDVNNNNVNVQVDGDLKLSGKKIKIDYGVEATPQKVHSHAGLTIGDNKYLDFLLKIQRGGANPHGNMNLRLKSILIVGGEYNYQNGKGTMNLNVELPTLPRKIKTTGDVTITGTQHVATIEILLDAEKDPSKHIKISTNTDVSKESIDSKNVIEILQYKTAVDVKGNLKSNGDKGYDLTGTTEITLPNDHYIVINADHHLVRDGKSRRLNGRYSVSDSLNKGGPKANIGYSTTIAWGEGPEAEYIGEHSLTGESWEGKTLKLSVSGGHERVPSTDKRKSEIILGLEGTGIPKSFLFALSAVYNRQEGEWKSKSTLGNDLGVMVRTSAYLHLFSQNKL